MIDKSVDKLIVKWLDENKERIITKWIELAKIPSITSAREENAPFGKECAKALEYAASLFDTDGIDVKVYKDGGYALAHYGKGEKTVGLFSHSDVVPVGEGWLYTEPFEPVIKEGSLIGRGVEDNKSGIIASLCLMEFLRDNSINLNSRIEAFIGSDEECGMKDLTAYLSEHKIPDISFVPDADFPCSTGEKGIYHFWAESNKAFSEISDISAGEAFNIVLDNVTVKIKNSESLSAELKKKTENAEEFTLICDGDYIVLKAKGIAKHASIPEGSVNAAYIAFKLLNECENLCENDRNILSGAVTALSCYYGSGLDISHEDINFGKLTCVNGMVKTEKGHLMLSFDVRYGDTLDSKILEEKADTALSNLGYSVTYKNNSAGFSIDKDSKVPQLLEDIYAEITCEPLKSVLMSGGTYARKLKNAFSVGTSVIMKDRKDAVLSMPDGHGGPHQCDERIDIEGFFVAVRILIHYVLECDKLFDVN